MQAVVGAFDLIYPDWMVGTWKVTSTLVDLADPLAPNIVTPGFESNRRYLNQPITFQVRFQVVNPSNLALSRLNPKSPFPGRNLRTRHSQVGTWERDIPR
ncbi:DUF6816 family protein [Microseira wollei]|uniref:DUF6816 family protein n=1 Tax=Microseira wollei TaxID=467598 RepID=UPI0035A25300